MNLPPEVTLLRWVNYHLEKAGHHRRVFNFNEDIKVFISLSLLFPISFFSFSFPFYYNNKKNLVRILKITLFC